jgi:hypothetical protein
MRLNSLVIACLAAPVWMSAQFSHLEVESVDNKGVVSGDTYRIYAVMENEGDVIDAVFGEAGKPLFIRSTKEFYQHPKGGEMASQVQRFDVENDAVLAFDSWVTIGLEDNYMNSLTGFLMEFTDFEDGKALETDNGAWFVTPDKRQALAPSDKRILLAQLTSSGKISGMLNIHGRTKGVTNLDGIVEGAELIQAEGVTFSCGE